MLAPSGYIELPRSISQSSAITVTVEDEDTLCDAATCCGKRIRSLMGEQLMFLTIKAVNEFNISFILSL